MVEREINWTSKALKDRTAIMEYWFRRTGDIDYPVKLERSFSATLSMLKNYPQAGTIFSKKHHIRFIVIRDFKIYYTYTNADLTVLTIWDTRQNPYNLNL